MKNKTKLVGIVAILIAIIAVTNKTQAVNQNVLDKMADKKSQMDDKKTETICNMIDKVGTRLESKIGEDGTQLRERLEKRVNEMNNNRVSDESDLEKRRQLRDQERNQFYSNLVSKAGDDQIKKEATDKFKVAVENAVKIRREEIDSAKETMNTELDQAIKNRETARLSLRNEFNNNLTISIDKAKNSCNDGTSSDELKNILNQFKENVKLNRGAFESKQDQTKKVQETIKQLREQRKIRVQKAIDEFKASMTLAQEELKKAMDV
jgi:hypothetical protein